MSEDRVSGPVAVPLVWLGVRRDTSERIDRFASRLVFLFFPLAPIFWLIAHFVGGGRILAAIWLLLLTFPATAQPPRNPRPQLQVRSAYDEKTARRLKPHGSSDDEDSDDFVVT